MTHGNPELDTVRTFLIHRFSPVDDVAVVGHGEWSSAFAFRANDEDFVVRFGQHRNDYDKDRIAATYAGPQLRVPEVVELGDAFGGFYAISRRARGDSLDGLDEARWRRVRPALFRTLDATRVIDISDTTGFGLWTADRSAPSESWRAFLLEVADDRPSRRTFGWRRLLASRPELEAVFEQGFAVLAEAVPACPEVRHVVHSDLFGNNVLVDGEKVATVLDWGCSLYGDFLYDLAGLMFSSPWHPELDQIDLRQEAMRHYEEIGLDSPDFDDRVRCYQVHIGLDAQAYNAFTHRWDEVERCGRRTLEVADTH